MPQIQNNTINKKRRSFAHLITDFWILIVPLILSSCMGIYEGGFECPPGKGLGCTSISDVNEKVNQGYGIQERPPAAETKDEECEPCKGKSCAPTLPQDEEIWFAPWAFRDQASDLRRWDGR